MSYPDLKTEAQYRQEIATCWKMIEADKECIAKLRAENEQLRKALELSYNLDITGSAYYEFDEARSQALSLPDLSTIPLARVRAEAINECAAWIESTDIHKLSKAEQAIFSKVLALFGAALRAEANEIKKEIGL